MNFSKLQRQSDGKKIVVGAQITHELIPMQQRSQKELLSICDEIEMDEVGYCAENRETFVSNDISCRDEAVRDKSSTGDGTQFEFIV